MAKVTKVISGTATGSTATTIYTVPTGKVARIECLLGNGIKTSDLSISWEGYRMSPQETITRASDVGGSSNSYQVLSNHPSYTYLTADISGVKESLRYITYSQAGTIVTARAGNYSILVVEEDAG